MLKASQEKMENEQRKDFVSKIHALTMNCIIEQGEKPNSFVEFKMGYDNLRKHVTLEKYNKYLDIMLYSKGNIRIGFCEPGHKFREYLVFEYKPEMDTETIEKFIFEFRELLNGLLDLYMEGKGWPMPMYIYMNTTPYCKGIVEIDR